MLADFVLPLFLCTCSFFVFLIDYAIICTKVKIWNLKMRRSDFGLFFILCLLYLSLFRDLSFFLRNGIKSKNQKIVV